MKRLSFYLLARSRLLNLLRKYIPGVVPKYAEVASNRGFEHKEAVIIAYWISGYDFVMNQYPLQPQAVNARWMHVTSDPVRMSTAVYKNLPYVE
jgi:hypothetical protein